MAFLKITGRVETFTDVLMQAYSWVDDLLVVDAEGRKTAIPRLHLRNDLLLALRQAQAHGSQVEIFIDTRPALIGRNQLFGLKTEDIAIFDKRDPNLIWSAIPTATVLAIGWLISVQYFYSHFDLPGFLFAAIIVQVGMLLGRMAQFVPLSLARFIWLIAMRIDRRKLFYMDAAEAARLREIEYISA
jgi:hypothetical protein